MNPEESLRIQTVRAYFASETGAYARKSERKLFLLEDLVHVHRSHGVLARGNQELVVAVNLIHDVLEIG